MSTTETTGAETYEEHMAKARRFAANAEDRSSHWDRSVDLQAAQVHATLAQTLKAAEMLPVMAALAASVGPVPSEPVAAEDAGEPSP